MKYTYMLKKLNIVKYDFKRQLGYSLFEPEEKIQMEVWITLSSEIGVTISQTISAIYNIISTQFRKDTYATFNSK